MKSMTLKFDEMPDEQFTDPEVFIIECLCQEDWKAGYRDGFNLYSQLLMSGRRPRYVQALSENDLKAALAMFRQSKCRFLHFSFHGTSDSIALGDGRCDYQSFAAATKGFLNSRRVFISACECGNLLLIHELYKTNHVIHSVLAHEDKVSFAKAESFWIPFYHALYERITSVRSDGGVTSRAFSERNMADLAGRLAMIVKTQFIIGFLDSKNNTIVCEQLKRLRKEFKWVRLPWHSE